MHPCPPRYRPHTMNCGSHQLHVTTTHSFRRTRKSGAPIKPKLIHVGLRVRHIGQEAKAYLLRKRPRTHASTSSMTNTCGTGDIGNSAGYRGRLLILQFFISQALSLSLNLSMPYHSHRRVRKSCGGCKVISNGY